MKKIISVIAVAASASFVNAQEIKQPSVQQETASLLGKQYVSAGLGFVDINHSQTDAYISTVAVNIPVTAGFDITAGYNYSWIEASHRDDAHEAVVAGTYYFSEGAFKPFGTVALSYVWPSYQNYQNNDRFAWATNLGFEYDLCSCLTASLSGGYSDDFHNEADQFSGVLAVNYSVTKSIVAQAAVAWLERGSVGYSLGVAYKF